MRRTASRILGSRCSDRDRTGTMPCFHRVWRCGMRHGVPAVTGAFGPCDYFPVSAFWGKDAFTARSLCSRRLEWASSLLIVVWRQPWRPLAFFIDDLTQRVETLLGRERAYEPALSLSTSHSLRRVRELSADAGLLPFRLECWNTVPRSVFATFLSALG